MAYNDTHPFLEIFNSFNHNDMLLAFFLSMLVGLLLGALVYVLLTWASRRKATARITQRRKNKSGSSSRSSQPMSSQMGLYRSTFLSVYRKPSLEPVGPLGSNPSPETSTFRPLPKKTRPSLDMGEDTKVLEDMASNSDSSSPVPNKRHSFWLGSNGLKGFFPLQSSPPAYDSVIHAFEETCT